MQLNVYEVAPIQAQPNLPLEINDHYAAWRYGIEVVDEDGASLARSSRLFGDYAGAHEFIDQISRLPQEQWVSAIEGP